MLGWIGLSWARLGSDELGFRVRMSWDGLGWVRLG